MSVGQLSRGVSLMERRTKGFIAAGVILIGVLLLPMWGSRQPGLSWFW
jgi:hypothetical protein